MRNRLSFPLLRVGLAATVLLLLSLPIIVAADSPPKRPWGLYGLERLTLPERQALWREAIRELDEAELGALTLEAIGATEGAPALGNRYWQTRLVGYHDAGGGGFNSDVWAHGDYAYIGTWGAFTEDGRLCPETGVKIFDVSDPNNPAMVRVLPSHPGTRNNDIKVITAETEFFSGDLMVVSNEECAEGGATGFDLWDVTDPTNPVHLATYTTGPTHNTYLFQRGDRVYVLLAVEFSEVFDPEGRGDFQIVDVTDPTNPTPVSDWGIGKDGGLAFGSPLFAEIEGLPEGADCTPPPGTPPLCRGNDFPGVFLHDVWASQDGNTALLAYWDAGVILLDISDPANPTMIGRAAEGAAFGSNEGNAHAAVFGGSEENVVIIGDEDFTPGPWGFARFFDASDPANPVELSQFATPGALYMRSPAVFSSAHNPIARGDTVYFSWYNDGLRIIDISDPSAPRELAFFRGGIAPDPMGLFSPFTGFWGVYEQDGLIYGSNINAGLYIVRHTPCTPGDGSLCGGHIFVQVFFDYLCDGRFKAGVDLPLGGSQVTLTNAEGGRETQVLGYNGWSFFRDIILFEGETATVEVTFPDGFAACPGTSSSLTFAPEDFDEGGIARAVFRATR